MNAFRKLAARVIMTAALGLGTGLGVLGLGASPAHADRGIVIIQGWTDGYGFPYRHWDRYERHYRPYLLPRHDPYWGERQRFRYRYMDGYHAGYPFRAACRPVYRNFHGRGQIIRRGATQCFDRWGRPYIVRGSEFVIRQGGRW